MTERTDGPTPRKPIQIAVDDGTLYVLADDGTLWSLYTGRGAKWQRFDPIPARIDAPPIARPLDHP